MSDTKTFYELAADGRMTLTDPPHVDADVVAVWVAVRFWTEMVDTGPGYVTAIYIEGQDDTDIYEWDYENERVSDTVRAELDGPYWMVKP